MFSEDVELLTKLEDLLDLELDTARDTALHCLLQINLALYERLEATNRQVEKQRQTILRLLARVNPSGALNERGERLL